MKSTILLRDRLGSAAPRRIVAEEVQVVLPQHRHATRAAGDDVVGGTASSRSMVCFAIDGGVGYVAGVVRNQPAAVQPARVDQLDAECLRAPSTTASPCSG